jgi:hypothetical protein
VIHLFMLVASTLTGVHVGNVQDCLLAGLQHAQNFVCVRPNVEEIPYIQRLEMLIAVELFLVSISDCIEVSVKKALNST